MGTALPPWPDDVPPRLSERWGSASEMLSVLELAQYADLFEEESLTLELLESFAEREGGEEELMDKLKAVGVKKMGQRQAIVNAAMRRA